MYSTEREAHVDQDNRDSKPNLVTQSHMLGTSLPPLCFSFLLYSKDQEEVGRLGLFPRWAQQSWLVGMGPGYPSFQDMGDLRPECAANPWEPQVKPAGIGLAAAQQALSQKPMWEVAWNPMS